MAEKYTVNLLSLQMAGGHSSFGWFLLNSMEGLLFKYVAAELNFCLSYLLSFVRCGQSCVSGAAPFSRANSSTGWCWARGADAGWS